MTQRISHWVGGESLDQSDGRTGTISNPATGMVTAEIPLASAIQVNAAVEAAQRAFDQWRGTSLTARTRVMFRLRELLNDRKDELAAIITAEHGKVLSDALGEITRALQAVEFACGIPDLLKGEFSAGVSTGVDAYSLRQPLGVVSVITPFNFPVMVPMWFCPIAIAAGNTVILKPSEKVPGAANWLARLWKEAGLPSGVFNVVHGDKEAVDAILEHPGISAVSFVGSTPVARYVYEKGTATGKRVQSLGGAKNHMVVLPDADLDLVADAAVSAAYGSAGERCMAVSALVAIEPVADQLITKIRDRMQRVTVGDGSRPGSEMGPLVTRAHRDRVETYVAAGVTAGAQLVVDGRGLHPQGEVDGFWLGPTLFDHVTPEMPIYTDEIFGPVLSVVRAASYESALELVNANPYGNGTAIFTNDGRIAHHYQQEVKVGMVGINVPIPAPMAYYSFGGWKNSLFGDTHAHGREGVHFYTRAKVVSARWLDPSRGGVDLAFPRNQ